MLQRAAYQQVQASLAAGRQLRWASFIFLQFVLLLSCPPQRSLRCVSGSQVCCLAHLNAVSAVFLAHRAAYQQVQASLAAGRQLRSALFWEWTFPQNSRGDRGVLSNDTTFT